jgi:hypothetical protein
VVVLVLESRRLLVSEIPQSGRARRGRKKVLGPLSGKGTEDEGEFEDEYDFGTRSRWEKG